MAEQTNLLNLLGQSPKDKEKPFEEWRTKNVNDNFTALQDYIYTLLNYQGEISSISQILSTNEWRKGWWWYICDTGTDNIGTNETIALYEGEVLLATNVHPDKMIMTQADFDSHFKFIGKEFAKEVPLCIKIRGLLNRGLVIVSDDLNYNGKTLGESVNVKKWDAFVVSEDLSVWFDDNLPKVGDVVISIGNDADSGEMKWIVLNGASLKSAVLELEKKVGDLKGLKTNAKNSVVSAVNEIKVQADKIGNLNNLNTIAKENVVAAVNEIMTKSNENGAYAVTLAARLAAIEQQLNGISFDVDSNGNLTYEKQEEVVE